MDKKQDSMENSEKLKELIGKIDTLYWLYEWRKPEESEADFQKKLKIKTDKHKTVLKEIETLLEETKMDVNERDENGYNALHWAVTNDNVALIKLLFKYGAVYKSDDNNSSLHRAATFGALNVVKYFIEEMGISPQKKSPDEYSVLAAARESKHSKKVVPYLVKFLLDSKYQKPAAPKKLKPLSEADVLAHLPEINLQPDLKEKLTEIITAVFVEEHSVNIQEFYEIIQAQEPDLVFACVDLFKKASSKAAANKSAKKIPASFYAHVGDLEITANCNVNSLLVTGNLTILGNIKNVEGCQIFVGGNLTCEKMHTEGPVVIGGDLVAKEIKAEYNDYSLKVYGKIIAEKLTIDNHAVIGDTSKVKKIAGK